MEYCITYNMLFNLKVISRLISVASVINKVNFNPSMDK